MQQWRLGSTLKPVSNSIWKRRRHSFMSFQKAGAARVVASQKPSILTERLSSENPGTVTWKSVWSPHTGVLNASDAVLPQPNALQTLKGKTMPLKIEFVRRSGQVLGSITSGFSDQSTTVRDAGGRITGHTSEKFSTTRDAAG